VNFALAANYSVPVGAGALPLVSSLLTNRTSSPDARI